MASESEFVAFDIPDMKAIVIATAGVQTIAQQRAIGIEHMTPLIRTAEPGAGGNRYDKTLWQISYMDSDTGTEKRLSLFGGPKGTLLLPSRKEMPKFRFGLLNPTDAGAIVTRPAVDPAPAYLSFLRASGAIT